MQCDQCGKNFRPKKPWQHFCQPKCRDDFHNAEKKRVAKEAKDDAYADEVAHHEARVNGHSVHTKKKFDVVARGLVKPKPQFGLLPVRAQPKKEEGEDQQVT